MVARVAAVLVFVSATSVLADVYTYECDSVPGGAGWDLFVMSCEGEEWVESGHLFQNVLECAEFPGFGAVIDYFHDIDALSDATDWFIEWRMETTGVSEEIPWVAPANLTVTDGNGFIYHFTIADDRVRLIVGFQLTHYVELTPGIHTYRLEVSGMNLDEVFTAYIDGTVIASGDPATPLFNPPYQAVVAMRAKSKLVPSTTTWDYIRWGDIPENGSGDFNSDGIISTHDLPFFQGCLETESGNWVGCAWADFSADGDVDCEDAGAFQLAWSGAGDVPGFEECAAVFCEQDLNGNSVVNAPDLAIVLGAWGPNPGHAADLNGDDTVDAADLASLLGAWGPCP